MAEVIASASAIAGLASLAVQLSQISFDYISSVMGASRAQKSYLQELSALTSILLRLQQAVELPDIDQLAGHRDRVVSKMAIDECMTSLSKLKSGLEKRKLKEGMTAKLSALTWPFDEKETKRVVESLHRYHNLFASAISADNLMVSVASYREVKGMKEEHALQGLIDWLSPRSLALNISGRDEHICHGTGSWFLKLPDYVAWRDGAENLLWTYGDPGCGKTVLASLVVDDLNSKEKQEVAVAFYAFQAFNSSLVSVQNLLRYLLGQFLRVPSCIPTKAQDLRERIAQSNRKPTIKELLDCLKATVSSLKFAYVVLDGLDEFPNRSDLLKALPQIQEHGVKVLVTSRDLPDIEHHFAKSARIKVEANPGDLQLYIRERLQTSHEVDEHQISERLVEDAILEITRQVGGSFLLVRLIMDNIAGCTTIKKIRRCLKLMPANVTEAYSSTLDRILQQTPGRIELAKQVLSWVCCVKRPLKVVELQHALAVEHDSADIDDENIEAAKTLVSVCLGLVTLSKQHQTINFIHSTAHEFIKDNIYRFSQNPDLEIARTCLAYLSCREFTTRQCATAKELECRLERMPLARYAARHFGYHVRPTEEECSSELIEFLNNDMLRENSLQILHFWPGRDENYSAVAFSDMPKHAHPLHVTAFWGLKVTSERLIQYGADVSSVDSRKWTPLHWAASQGHADVAHLFIERGASIDPLDDAGWSPLFWATLKGHVQTTSLLLQNGASTALRDRNGWTAFQWATCSGQEAIVKLLIEHGAGLPLASQKEKPKRVRLKDLRVSQVLKIFRFENTTESLSSGEPTSNPLELAANARDLEIFIALVENSAAMDKQKISLFEAVNGYWEREPPVYDAWRALSKVDWVYLANEPRLQTSTAFQKKLLERAIKDEKLPIVKSIIDMGLDLNADLQYSVTGMKGRTHLHTAAYCKNLDIATYLLEKGADPTICDDLGQTPLHVAAKFGFKDVVAVILARSKAVINKGDKRGRTPLHLACAYGLWRLKKDQGANTAICQLLLENGASATLPDDDGSTALHLACKSWDLGLIKLLIDLGCPSETLDNQGMSLLHRLACPVKEQWENWRNLTEMNFASPEEKRAVVALILQEPSKHHVNLVCHTANYQKETITDTPLSLSIEKCQWELAQGLVNVGARLVTTRPLTALLFEAARAGIPDIVQILLEHGADPNEKEHPTSKYFEDPLLIQVIKAITIPTEQKAATPHQALCSGTLDIDEVEAYGLVIDRLRDAGVETLATDSEGRNALELLIQRTSNDALAQKLLDIGINPHYSCPGTFDAFLQAAIFDRAKTLSCLLDYAKGHPEPSHWLSPFLTPTMSITDPDANLSLICLALKSGKLLNAQDACGHSLLYNSIANHNELLTNHLLSSGADINAVDPWGWGPLHKAIAEDKPDLLQQLLDKGARVADQARSNYEFSPNYPPQYYEDHPKRFQPLHIAIDHRNAEIVSMLLDHGADVNAHMVRDDSSKASALQYALDRSLLGVQPEVVKILVERGAEVKNMAVHLRSWDIRKFEGFDDTWDVLRGGIEGDGEWVDVDENDWKLAQEDARTAQLGKA